MLWKQTKPRCRVGGCERVYVPAHVYIKIGGQGSSH